VRREALGRDLELFVPVCVNGTTSAASNGFMLNSELAGQFDVAAKTASGEGDWSR
jgi:hypothetical protein